MTAPPSLWVLPDDAPPLSHVLAAYRAAQGPADACYWLEGPPGSTSFGHHLVLRPSETGYGFSVNAISPRLVWTILRHPAPVVVALELNLAVLYAALTRVVRRHRRLVVLVEGDLSSMGRTGSNRVKTWFRRLLAPRVDAFVANSSAAAAYLRTTLGVPERKIVQGWWLAGLPDDLEAVPPGEELLARREGPTFVTVGQLISRKGHDRLIRAAGRYVREVGPCQVWIAGDGPLRTQLEQLAEREGIADRVTFLGQVGRAELKGVLQAADVFVFATLNDLVGRALVEALSVGVPVVVSRRSGAWGTLLHDGVGAVSVDPEDPEDLFAGLRAATAPGRLEELRRGARRTATEVSVEAAAAAVAAGIATAVSGAPGPLRAGRAT